MNELHLDDFRKDSAIALVRLYNNFPREHTLYVSEICTDETTDEFGLPSKRHDACMAAFVWLADENIIRYKQLIAEEGVEQAVLTAKGLKLLLSPSMNKVPFIKEITQAIQSGSSRQLEKIMNSLVLSIETN